MSLRFLMFHPTISMLKSTAMLCLKLFVSSTSCASRANQVRCSSLITAQVGSFFFLCFGPCWPWPIVESFLSLAHYQPWLVIGPFWILACRWPLLKFGSLLVLAHCQPILDFGSSLARFKVWLIVSPIPLLAPFGVLIHYRPFWTCIHQSLAAVAGCTANLYLF